MSLETSAQVEPQPFRPTTEGWSARRAFGPALHIGSRGFATLMIWYDVAQERRSLRSMSDEMLEDIGISRADAMREAGRRFWDMDETR